MEREAMAACMPVSAAILCGGLGRRMGGADKSQLVVAGRSFIDLQLAVLRPLTSDVMLVDRDDQRAVADGVRLVTDRVRESGALGGLFTALDAAEHDRVIVLACDMPFVTTEFLEYLIERATADAVVPVDARGRHPICGVFHRRIAPALKLLIASGRLRVEAALATLDVREIGADDLRPFDTDGRLLLNVNTPYDYRRAAGGDSQVTAFA
jgi:molybdopterin-guanine dinucleotide biosynthesis protein A